MFPILAAFINRFRGGWMPTGRTQVARAGFSAAMSILFGLATGDWFVALLLLPAWFLGCLAGHGDGMSMGRGKASWIWSAGDLFASGLANVGLVAGILWGFGYFWIPVVIAGALKWLAYEIGWRIPDLAPGFHRGPEMGEVMYGTFHGTALMFVTGTFKWGF